MQLACCMLSSHIGQVDPYDCFKRRQLERIIFVSRGLRSRNPLSRPIISKGSLMVQQYLNLVRTLGFKIILHRIISVV